MGIRPSGMAAARTDRVGTDAQFTPPWASIQARVQRHHVRLTAAEPWTFHIDAGATPESRAGYIRYASFEPATSPYDAPSGTEYDTAMERSPLCLAQSPFRHFASADIDGTVILCGPLLHAALADMRRVRFVKVERRLDDDFHHSVGTSLVPHAHAWAPCHLTINSRQAFRSFGTLEIRRGRGRDCNNCTPRKRDAVHLTPMSRGRRSWPATLADY